jgi:DNA-binding NtrC family response regulator
MVRGEILLIDDDEMILVLTQRLLEDAGFSVITTADGPQGVELYGTRHPDVVLLDLGLPSVNGMVALKEIRELDPRAKVIVISGYASQKAVDEALALGALDFLPKPLNAKELMEKVSLAVLA